MSCRPAVQAPGSPPGNPQNPTDAVPDYAWTDLTYLLHEKHVSWRYYVMKGTEPDCEDDAAVTCKAVPQDSRTPGIWNPLPYFDTVHENWQLDNVTSTRNFFKAAKAGKLPAVSWIVPSQKVSEHPPGLVSAGQAYVTTLINAVMRSPNWSSTAIFLAWDDWGGFYDHVVPPYVDQASYGIRVPGLVISPYAKRGYIDHQTLSFDAYLKFIEDDFTRGQRLDPRTDGRPDRRPTVRENAAVLGNLASDFDFNQQPRAPYILPQYTPPRKGDWAAGVVTAVENGKLKVQVTARQSPGQPPLIGSQITVSVLLSTKIFVLGAPTQLSAVKTGDGITLTLVHNTQGVYSTLLIDDSGQ